MSALLFWEEFRNPHPVFGRRNFCCRHFFFGVVKSASWARHRLWDLWYGCYKDWLCSVNDRSGDAEDVIITLFSYHDDCTSSVWARSLHSPLEATSQTNGVVGGVGASLVRSRKKNLNQPISTSDMK